MLNKAKYIWKVLTRTNAKENSDSNAWPCGESSLIKFKSGFKQKYWLTFFWHHLCDKISPWCSAVVDWPCHIILYKTLMNLFQTGDSWSQSPQAQHCQKWSALIVQKFIAGKGSGWTESIFIWFRHRFWSWLPSRTKIMIKETLKQNLEKQPGWK